MLSSHLFVFWLLLNVLLCTLLFKEGFLLSKHVIPQRSVCKEPMSVEGSVKYCGKRSFSRAVIVVIDALRFDFALFDEENKKPEHFENKLSIFKQLEESGKGKLFRFVADPPTTTMQRLKGLMTGSLPTFIEASQNFGSSEIEEDNLIAQLKDHGRKVIFAGDDTWLQLFNSSSFTQSHPFPSFNVWDLDTVDEGVRSVFAKVLDFEKCNNKSDNDIEWHVLIGHYLGVDHAGHKFGPRHPQMARKLVEMNEDLSNIVKSIDDDTLLVVFGDHGMTESGDHGGDSLLEVSSALFVYSPRLNFERKSSSNKHESVSHVDIVPTLASLLALPTPFSNLGKRMKVLMDANEDENVVYANVEQVINYLAAYRLSGGTLPDSPYFRLRTKFERLSDMRLVANASALISMAESMLDEAKALCEATWAQFDLKLMSAGITLLFMLLVLLFCFLRVSEAIDNSLDLGFVINLFCSMVIGLLMGLVYILLKSSFEYTECFSIVLLFATGISVVNFGLSLLWRTKQALHKASMINFDSIVVMVVVVVIVLITTFSLFSNSLVVNEASVTQFALISLVVVHSFIALRKTSEQHGRMRIIVVATLMCLCTRLSSSFWRCREEQQGYCVQNDYFKALNTLEDGDEQYKNSRFALTIISIVISVLGHRVFLGRSGNNSGHGLVITLNSSLPLFAAVATLFFWALQARESSLSLGKGEQSMLASFSLLSCVVMVIVVVVRPSGLICINTDEDNSLRAKQRSLRRDSMEAVSGLHSALSAPFVAIHCALSIVFMLLLGDGLAPSVLLTTLMQACILLLGALSYGCTGGTSTWFISLLSWQLTESLSFYTTSHQPTFTTIPWSAAFILGDNDDFSGKTFFSLNFILPLIFVVANMFYNRLIFGLMLPLLPIMPYSLKAKLGLDEREGEEMLLHPHYHKSMKSTVTKTICCYIFLLALRLLASMMAAAVLRRHLMLWKIFAPRFIYEAVGFCVSSLALFSGHLLFGRVYSDLISFHNSLRLQRTHR